VKDFVGICGRSARQLRERPYHERRRLAEKFSFSAGQKPVEDLSLYAIVRTGGKQYRVAEKTVFSVEKLEVNQGETVELTDVLLLADGENVKIGSPIIAGAKVVARVLETAKGRKINGFTYKPKKNVRRHYGHRQWFTRLRVESIEG
jgi:large subunit ribosomal protein L21